MTEAEKAYKAALEEIERVKREGGELLRLDGERFRALDRIPPQIAEVKGLEALNLSNTAITDLHPLAKLTDLLWLWINHSAVSDITSLSELMNLRKLFLDNTAIANIAPLSALSKLEHLYLGCTSVVDLAPIAGLSNLQGLYLDNTSVTDLGPVTRLYGLQILYLNNAAVIDIGPIAGLSALQHLNLSDTEVVDIAPLAKLRELLELDLSGSRVTDLRPTRRLKKLGTQMGLEPGLSFTDTPATQRDADLARLTEIKNSMERTRETLAYLNTLPPWPEPYLPKARPDGKPPEWIGAAPPAPPAVRTAETQIRALLRHAQVTRISAAVFAEQIATALREVPATNGNELVPVLQIMAEVGEVLSLIARQEADARNAETRLRLRISQLETLVDRLTRQLADAEKALEAEKALGRSEGFMAAYRKSFGEESGKWSARLVFVGVPAAMGHFLGLDNPVVEALNKVLEQLPKG